MGTVFFAFLHHLAVLIVFACLFHQHLAVKPDINLQSARRLQRIDMVYGISAVVLLIAGAARVAWFEKGAAYYLDNWPFFIKVALFIAVGLISIYPTTVFLKWRRYTRIDRPPPFSEPEARRLAMAIRAELLLFVLIIPPAVLMAKGYGLLGE